MPSSTTQANLPTTQANVPMETTTLLPNVATPLPGFSVSDSDPNATDTEQYVAEVADGSHGLLSVSDAGGANVSENDSPGLTIKGTLAQVNDALATLKDDNPDTQAENGHFKITLSVNPANNSADKASNSAEFIVNKPGSAVGDVHLVTFDGLHYDFQATGAFELARSTIPGNAFQVQIQTAALPGVAGVSYITQVAAGLGDGERVTFAAGRDGVVWIDGQPATGLDTNDPIHFADGSELVQFSPTGYALTWSTGETLTVEEEGQFFDVNVALAASDGPGSVQGLLGIDNGQANDFTLPDGTVLPQPLSGTTLYGEFANAWRVTGAASLLDSVAPPAAGATVPPESTATATTPDQTGAETIVLTGANKFISVGDGPAIVTGGAGHATVWLGNGADSVDIGGWDNTVIVGDGQDSIDAGAGTAAITLGDGNDIVVLQGRNNVVTGGDGSDSVTGGGNADNVTLGNGNDTVQVGGPLNIITLGNGINNVVAGSGQDSVTVGHGANTITLAGRDNSVTGGNGDDSVSGSTGDSQITLGDGQDSVQAAGDGNTVKLGNGHDTVAISGGDNSIVAGDGGDSVTGGTNGNQIVLGSGNNAVQLTGWANSVTVGGGISTVDAGLGTSTVVVTGGQIALSLHGHGNIVFLGGDSDATISDQSAGLSLTIDSADVVARITGFGASSGARLDLAGLGFSGVQQVLAGLQSDGHGGALLSDVTGPGYVDFTNLAPSALHAANFMVT